MHFQQKVPERKTIMDLRKQFEQYHYLSLLKGDRAADFQLDISYFLEEENRVPKELLDIFISCQGDELFLLLRADGRDIHALCEEWDQKTSVFAAFGSEDRAVLRKLKYNIIQIILCRDENVDRTEEGSLNITRKIILPYDTEADGTIEIPDMEAVELPFYMISSGEFSLNSNTVSRLEYCMSGKMPELLFQKRKSGRGQNRTFELGEYEQIEGWLRNVYQEREGN